MRERVAGYVNRDARDMTRSAKTPLFDKTRLEEYLRQNISGFSGPLTIRRFGDGQSNPTFLLVTRDRKYVLRKKPDGVLLPSAHAVDREYLVMRAIRGLGVPIPEMLCLCEDDQVIGSAFFIMSHVEGRIFWEPTLPELSRDERSAAYDDANRVIARLHDVDYVAAGLAGFGRSGNYLERQVARWSKQYLASQTEPIEAMERLIEWLPEHLPPARATSLVHGDLRLDNMIFHPQEPRVIALLDWELSTLGDALADLSYHMLTWLLRPEEFRGMQGTDLATLGIPAAADYLARYAKRRGLGKIDSELWDYHIVYNLFRLAAILQGIAKRAADGTAAATNAGETGARARVIAAIAWRRAVEALGAI
jgi:aminoglycoside phosphotransferase (APT) family kinase protein